MNLQKAIIFSAALLLIGCNHMPVEQMPTAVRLTAIGYGAASSADGHTPGQRKLLAMRASRLDAYRALAEQVYGVRLTGNTTVSSLMSQNDNFRAYIDAYLRGARVVSVTPLPDGNIETTIEIDFNDGIVRPFLVQPVQPAPSAQPAPQPLVSSHGINGTVGPGRHYGSTFYFAE